MSSEYRPCSSNSNFNNNTVSSASNLNKTFSGMNYSPVTNTMTSGYSTSTNLSSSMTGSSIMSASMTSSGASSSGTISSLTSPLQSSSVNMTSPSSASTMSMSSPRQIEIKESNLSVSSSSVATLTPSGNENKNSSYLNEKHEYKRVLDPSNR